ncbi:MAG TPA: hypothetical protein VF456_08335 [Vicinamibacterales bacterium]
MSNQSASIQFENNTFKVIGWPAPATAPSGGWSPIFAVYVEGASDALLGSYTVENRTLIFRPQFPLAAGVRYRAVFRQPGSRAAVEQTFNGPPRSVTPTTRVYRVFPTADTLPSNQLRMYVYFSAPMSRGEATRRVHLVDKDGRELRAEFLPGEELWDPNVERLTLTFDPGRIKRGLTSNQKMGPPIIEGQQYTLVVDREWPDAHGVPLVDSYRKRFRGGPALRKPPDTKLWKLTRPNAGTMDPLIVDFDRPMNYPLLLRMLQVSAPHGRIEGTVSVDRQESQWRFTPKAPWTAGAHRLIVDTALEDLAGNKIGQPFDIDVFDRVTEHITTTTVDVPFTVR